jgi:HK97 family phage prohead protease
MDIERFFFDTDQIEFDLLTDAESNPTNQVSGYAMKWNTLSHDRGGYRDVFRPGAFGDSLYSTDSVDVKAYYDHETNKYLARTGNGTLRLSTDEKGLKFSFDLPDTQLGRDVKTLIQRGDIPGMSFGYFPDKYRWKDEAQGPIREHLSGRLVEVSVVHDPGIPKTELVLHSLQKWKDKQKQEQEKTPQLDRIKRILKLSENI